MIFVCFPALVKGTGEMLECFGQCYMTGLGFKMISILFHYFHHNTRLSWWVG